MKLGIFLVFIALTVSLDCVSGQGAKSTQDQNVDAELSRFSDLLASQIRKSAMKKIAVVDFADLEGSTSALGVFVAEEITVNLVSSTNTFSVIDRGNLAKLLAEHKLTVTGLIQPENAKKFGQISGVDALVLGTMTPLKDSVRITAKIISTETAEITGAAKGQLTKSPEILKLLEPKSSQPAKRLNEAEPTPKALETKAEVKPVEKKISKSFGSLNVQFESLQIIDGRKYMLTMTVANQNSSASIAAAIQTLNDGYYLDATIIDANGNEFVSNASGVAGLVATPLRGSFYQYPGSSNEAVSDSTEISGGDSISVSITFIPKLGENYASRSKCRVNLKILTLNGVGMRRGPATSHSISAQLPVN